MRANPIAGPFILGISSGAKLVLSLVMIGFLSRGVTVGSLGLIAAAFSGAMLSMGFVLLISAKVKRMSLLIIGGVMIGYICSAITDFVVAFADDANIVNLHNWSRGSFSGMLWENVGVMAAVVLLVLVLTFLLSRRLSAGRSVRPEHGREHQSFSGGADPSLQRSLRHRHCLCGTHLLRGRGGAPSHAEPLQDR